jgi:hypothetical protein
MMMEIAKILRHQWDRAGAITLVAVGLVALFLGWLGASDTSFPAEQIPYVLSGGLLALCLIAIGTTLWLSADLRDEWRKLDALDGSLQEQTEALKSLLLTDRVAKASVGLPSSIGQDSLSRAGSGQR